MRTKTSVGVLVLVAIVATFSVGLVSPADAESSFTVDTDGDTVDTDPGDGSCVDPSGKCSLRAAIQEANALLGADTVLIPDGTYVLALGDIPVSDEVTVDGDSDDAELVTIDGNHDDRIFDVGAGAALTIRHVTLANGRASSSGEGDPAMGGAIRHDTGARVDVANARFIDNRAEGASTGNRTANGGAIGGRGVLSVAGSSFDRNAAIGGNGEVASGPGTYPEGGGDSNGSAIAALAPGSASVSTSSFEFNESVGGSAGNFTGTPDIDFLGAKPGGSAGGTLTAVGNPEGDPPRITIDHVTITGDSAVSGLASSVLSGSSVEEEGGLGSDATLIETFGPISGLAIRDAVVRGGNAGTPSEGGLYSGAPGGSAILVEGEGTADQVSIHNSRVVGGKASGGRGGAGGDGGFAIGARFSPVSGGISVVGIEVIDSVIEGGLGGDARPDLDGDARAGGAAGGVSGLILGGTLDGAVLASQLTVAGVDMIPGSPGANSDASSQPAGVGVGLNTVGGSTKLTNVTVTDIRGGTGGALPLNILSTDDTVLSHVTVTDNDGAIVPPSEVPVAGVMFIRIQFPGEPEPPLRLLSVNSSAIDGGNAGLACIEQTIAVVGEALVATVAPPELASDFSAASDGSCAWNGVGNFDDVADFGFVVDTLADPVTSGGVHAVALAGDSPLVDAGATGACTDASGGPLGLDGRGSTRPIDGDIDGTVRCDIGAFERTVPLLTDLTPTDATVAEGSPHQVRGTTSVPGGDVSIAWGDGTTSTTTADIDGDFSATHAYADNGGRTISLTALDPGGEPGPAVNVSVNVTNAAPSITNVEIVSPSPTRREEIQVTVAVTDPGTADTHTLQIGWGDRTTTGPQGSLVATHTYKKAGVYTLTLTVRDDDGGTETITRSVTVTRTTGKPPR